MDLTGKKFGTFTVVRRGPDKYPRIRNGYRLFNVTWVCKCDCGVERVKVSQAVKKGERCRMCFAKTRRLPGVEGANRNLLSTYRRSAKERKIAWNLPSEEFFVLIHLPCHYCGKRPEEEPVATAKPQRWYRNGNEEGISFPYNGLDRVDCSKPYELSNVVPCCATCNYAKNQMSYTDFMKWIHRLRGES